MDSGTFKLIGKKLSPETASITGLFMATLLVLSACGGSGGDTPVDDSPTIPPVTAPPVDAPTPTDDDPNALRDVVEIDDAYAYVRSSRYANVLQSCAVIENAQDACPLEVLPFIIQDAPDPTVDDIMSRVLVTHDWMGERFETILRSSSASLTSMFGSVTSILIGSTVRPSNYWGGTGGIQLDPTYLWMSVEEKMTVSVDEDFRSGFGNDLQFLFFQARLKDGVNQFTTFNLLNDATRTLEDIRIPTVRLLYHELAHANDFLPRTAAPFLSATGIPSDALDELSGFWLSPQLVNDQPLNSAVLKGLAGVRYRGFDATEFEKSLTATVVGSEAANDGAAVFYGYSTIREDFATLVDTAMMKAEFGIDLAAGFVDSPDDRDNAFCDDYTVGWGTRNRFSDPLVLARARTALEGIFGESARLDQFIAAQVGNSDPMTPGLGWCDERDLRAPANDSVVNGLLVRSAQRATLLEISGEMSDMDRHSWAEEKRSR